MTFWLCGHVTKEKPYNCITTIPIASKSGRVVTYGWRTQSAKSRDLLITWSCGKLWNLYLQFSNTHGSQTWEDGGLGWGTQSTKSRERLTKWSSGHYLSNVFETSVAILLIMLSLLIVVLSTIPHLNFETSPLPPLSMLFASIWESFLAQASVLLLFQHTATLDTFHS